MIGSKKIFIFCGEPSGDSHGAKLINSLRSTIPGLDISAVAGPEMRKEGVELFLKMEDFSVMGFTDVIAALPRLVRMHKQIQRHILERRPDGVILIDYPEFNILLAKALRKKGYRGKIVQYISPTVWAWRPKRAEAIARYCDLLLTIYPFESHYYAHTGLDVRYVGNPTKAKVKSHPHRQDWKQVLSLPAAPLMALFPGSRKSEIQLNFSKQLAVAEKLKKADPALCFGISCTSDAMKAQIESFLSGSSLAIGRDLFFIPREYSYELMQSCCCALAKSGTVTLELAMHRTPTVVMYNVSRINKFIAKQVLGINLPFYCMANILLGQQVFPEFVEADLSIEEIYAQCRQFLYDEETRNLCSSLCRQVEELLSDAIAEKEAAKAVKEIL